MSGVVQVEGKSEGVYHPQLGEIKTDGFLRRSFNDFPPLAWFTTQIKVPECLIQSRYFLVRPNGEKFELDLGPSLANAIALNRIALGFRIADVSLTPWPDHYGYATEEGRELNATAHEAGDDPDDWYVSEHAVDVLKISEIWGSSSILKPKLKRLDDHVKDVRKMVALCREQPGVYIPPSWLTEEQADSLVKKFGLPKSEL